MNNSKVLYSRPYFKKILIWLLSHRWINFTIVKFIKMLPNMHWRQRIPVIGGPVVCRMLGASTILLTAPDRCDNAKELFWFDGNLARENDRSSVDTIIRLSADCRLFLDIGSYTGLFSLLIARAHSGIYCKGFEIVPENFLLFQRNVIINDLIGRITPQLLGVGAEPGEIRMPVTLEAGVLPSGLSIENSAGEGVAIAVQPLDMVLPDLSERFTAKIDVEGFEHAVFSGARALIERCKPDFLCEILLSSTNCAEIEAQLSLVGYSFFVVTENGLQKRGALVPVKEYRDWLFTCRTEADLNLIGIQVINSH